jgi:transposase InsO family protein
MSRRGTCWNNAVAESFFSSLKKERIKKKIAELASLHTPRYLTTLILSTIQRAAIAT